MNKKRTIVNSALVLGIAGAGFAGYSTIGTGASAAAVTNTVVTAQTGNGLSKVTGTGNVITPSQASVAFDSAVSSTRSLPCLSPKATR